MASLRTRFRTGLVAGLGRWARRRQGDDVLPVTLQARRVYILPTRAGVGFGLLLATMLVAGLNYSNSMALLLTFLLAGYTILGIHETQRNLKGLRVVYASAADCFAGASARLELRFENTLHLARGPIRLRLEGGDGELLELPPRSVVTGHVDYTRPRRGRHRLGRIELSTTAPLGLFRAWCWLHLPVEAIVYPAAVGERPLPQAGGRRHQAGVNALAVGNEEWTALRPFVVGDSPRAVAWKLYARGAPLLVSQYSGATGSLHVLDYRRLDGLPPEARLMQICAWVLQAEQSHQPYSLWLPGVELARGSGPQQRLRALRALALYGEIGR